MGLTDEDLAYIGVKNAAQRKALKLGAPGLVELLLQVEISAFFNFHSELVRQLEAAYLFSVFLRVGGGVLACCVP